MTETCPRQELHTPAPSGYLQWHAWAQRMRKTHRQERCPGCDLYAIWRLRGLPRGVVRMCSTRKWRDQIDAVREPS